jgi:hypothetical protein
VRLVGFIIRKFISMHGHMNVQKRYCLDFLTYWGVPAGFASRNRRVIQSEPKVAVNVIFVGKPNTLIKIKISQNFLTLNFDKFHQQQVRLAN